jgi:hypothetical protein
MQEEKGQAQPQVYGTYSLFVRIALKGRFRTDTDVHYFNNWLRTHDQPQDTNFFKRFLADGQLPEHASRGLNEAKMRSAGNYSDEDMHLFHDAWKLMLFTP